MTEWRYRENGIRKHALVRYHGETLGVARCGMGVAKPVTWLGATKAERDHMATLPECKACRRSTWRGETP